MAKNGENFAIARQPKQGLGKTPAIFFLSYRPEYPKTPREKMLRVIQSVSAEGAARYFDEALVRGDYYSEEDRSIGTWGGKAAERLELRGHVQRDDFIALSSNLDPRDGERLTVRTKKNRTAGYDFTFSVPKSVSLFIALNPETEMRQMVLEACRETMRDIEAEMKTRVRGQDANGNQLDTERITGNLVYTAFVHETTRPINGVPDPHFHIHCYVLNATYDEEEKRWKAGFFRDLKGDAPYFEASFHARVAEKLLAAGYAIRRTERDFELASVTRETIEKFSRRTVEIEQLVRANLRVLERRANSLVAQRGLAFGEAFAIVKAGLGAKTREAKDKGKLDPAARLVHWESLLAPDERQALTASAVKDARSQDLLAPNVAQELAIAGSFERNSVVTRRRLEAAVLRLGIGRMAVREADRFVARDSRLVPAIGTRQDQVTTHSVLEEEREAIRIVRAGHGLAEAWDPQGSNWNPTDRRLNGQQIAAIRHLLSSEDQWVGIRGAAGTGKTTMMREAASVVSAFAERDVVVFAPSSASAEVLRAEGFSAETVQMLMHNEGLQAETAGKILWVDEAGFLSSHQMLWLARYAAEHNARVILSGDPHQHHAVERGDMLRILMKADAVRVAELTAIQRQKDPQLRAAIHALSTGEVGRGFEMLEAQGRITEIEDDSERDFALVQKHLAAVAGGQTSLIVSPTHAEAQNVADKIREALRASGRIRTEERVTQRLANTGWGYAERRDAARYRPGLIVEFHRGTWSLDAGSGSRRLRFNRNEHWRVVEAGENKVLLERERERAWLATSRASDFSVYDSKELRLSVGDTIRVSKNHVSLEGVPLLNNQRFEVEEIRAEELVLSNGATLDLRRALHLDQGYAVTSHSSQGQTVHQVLVAAPVRSMDLVSAIMFYVGVSRARSEVHVFTDSRAALLEAVEENLGVRTAAVEATGEVKPTREEIERKDALKRRREERQQARDLIATAREQKRETQRQVDREILARLFRSGRLGTGRNRDDLLARARRLLDESGERERREIGGTLERLIAAIGRKKSVTHASHKRMHTRDMKF